MCEDPPDGGVGAPRRRAALGPGDGLTLAAAPTFAAMAVLTGLRGGGDMAVICGAAPTPLGGMVPMYLLMSAFHLAPWLRLVGGRLPSLGPHRATLQSRRATDASAASMVSEDQLKGRLQDQASP